MRYSKIKANCISLCVLSKNKREIASVMQTKKNLQDDYTNKKHQIFKKCCINYEFDIIDDALHLIRNENDIRKIYIDEKEICIR